MKKFLIIGMGLILFFYGCGKKVPPLPIEESIPKDIYFEIKPTQAGFELLITLPTETQGGYTLTKIRKLIIEKKEVPLEGAETKEKIYKIKLSPKIHSAGNLIVYNDYKVKNKRAYTYRLKIKKDFLVETPYTKPITVYWHNPPKPPLNFRIKVYKKRVLLTWERPRQDIYGLPLEGKIYYEIEKVAGSKITIIKIKDRQYFWDNIDYSQKTCYAVKAILDFKGTFIPGSKTYEECLTFKKSDK